ncbi:MAG: hypothetical protein H7Y04_01990 [Verrucomicrobia bacterium]|nr:hypothetical protein [Cytophagales bacterium]
MKILPLLFIGCLFLYSCESSCIQVAKEYEKESYAFRIDTMYRPFASKTWMYEGNGQQFYSKSYNYFEGMVAIGDSIVKEKGKLEVTVFKKDTTFVYPFRCGTKILTVKNIH